MIEPQWRFIVDGMPHVVALGPWRTLRGAPDAFRCDEVALNLRGRPLSARSCAFDIAGRAAVLTKRVKGPTRRIRLKRAFGSSWRHLPATITAYALAGPGVGGGVAGASAVNGMLAWVIYELMVDETSQGAWVATAIDGFNERWAFVPAGGALPDGTDPAWRGPTSMEG